MVAFYQHEYRWPRVLGEGSLEGVQDNKSYAGDSEEEKTRGDRSSRLQVDFFFVTGERPLCGVLLGSRRCREAPSFTRGTREKPGRAIAHRR